MTDLDQLLPNPFAALPVAQSEQVPAPPEADLADVVAAIEAELRAWLDPPPIFLADEFRDRMS